MATAANPSGWTYVKLAYSIRTKLSAQHHILMILAGHADKNGACWPGYDQLLQESAIKSDRTLTAAPPISPG